MITSNLRWELRVLGPIELLRDGALLSTRRQVRVVLGWLAVHRDGISVDRLVELAWGDAPKVGASRQVVELLRFGPDGPVVMADGRARLDRATVVVDEDRFAALLHPEPSRADLEEALGLWRGDPYSELDHHADALASIHRLERQRDEAMGALYALRLLEPEVARVVADLSADALRHPTSARLPRLLAAGLAMAGRRVEALRTARAAAADDPRSQTWAPGLEAAIQADDVDALRSLVVRLGT